jgi:hypothetical protein
MALPKAKRKGKANRGSSPRICNVTRGWEYWVCCWPWTSCEQCFFQTSQGGYPPGISLLYLPQVAVKMWEGLFVPQSYHGKVSQHLFGRRNRQGCGCI